MYDFENNNKLNNDNFKININKNSKLSFLNTFVFTK